MRQLAVVLGVALALVGLTLPGPAEEKKGKARPGVVKVPFGKTADGKAVDLYVLTNDKGTVAKVMSYGATLTELHVADKDGKLSDVVLGYDDLKGYQSKGNPFFGSTVGRYANRIAKGRFTLDEREYKLAVNNGPNHLHGGLKGFDKAVWTAKEVTRPDLPTAVGFTYTSPDAEEGYPGKLTATVIYQLTDNNELKLFYTASADKATPVNLTNHTYFNLAGQGSGDILGHELTLKASHYTPTDEGLIPTGEIKSVKGTPYDFLKPHTIDSRIKEVKGGYDINYVLDKEKGVSANVPQLGAVVREPKSGRVMEMLTTEPGVQFYTGNFLDGTVKGKGGAVYEKHAGFCLEAQHYPDSPNQPKFPSAILRPGKLYSQVTVYKFSAK